MTFHGACSRWRSERGGVAVIWAICMTVIMLFLTLVFDGVAMLSLKKDIQTAADIAALTGAQILDDDELTDDEIRTQVSASFLRNVESVHGALSCDEATATFDRDSGDIQVVAVCWYAPMLGGTIAPSQIRLESQTSAYFTQARLDLSMVLDLSGSMNGGGKLDALKSASKLAAKTLLESGREGDIRVSFVGYSKAVNVLDYGFYAWGDSSEVEPIPEGMARVFCVSERVGDGAWDDRPPGPDAYFPYAGNNCPDEGLFTLSSDLGAFSNAIDDLNASGGTAGHVGVAWGWYLLSPKWSAVWPEASKPLSYDAENSVKAVILMTDGAFNNATHSAYGTSSQQAVKLCEQMRDEGIEIYAIAFSAPPAGQQTLKDCAGELSNYYEAASNEELIAAFESIAQLLVVLKLTG